MANLTTIGEDELLAALRDALAEGPDSDGAMTTSELCAALGLRPPAVWAHLRQLKEAGRLEVVKVRRVRLDDVPQRVPAYRLIGEA